MEISVKQRAQSNPDYPASNAEVREVIERLRANPKMPVRPVVILTGYHSPRAQGEYLRRMLLRLTSPGAPITTAAYMTRVDMPSICSDAMEQVRGQVGDGPVDLVGISMGGLIARVISTDAALPSTAGTIAARVPVNTRRIFTLASPHCGALLADRVALDPAAKDMQRGSAFLGALDAALRGGGGNPAVELTCYSRLRDGWVGAKQAAPAGQGVIWTPGVLWGSHLSVSWDRRILADLALRLRGEEPLARPGTPPRD